MLNNIIIIIKDFQHFMQPTQQTTPVNQMEGRK